MTDNDTKRFFAAQENDKLLFIAVEIKSPSIGAFRLVKDYIGDIVLNVDSVPQTFSGALVDIPEVSILQSDDTEKGSISFNRIGYEALTAIRALDDAVLEDVEVKIFTYLSGDLDPKTEYLLYAGDFSFTENTFTIKLTTENLEKQTRANEIVTTQEFPGIIGS